MNDGIIMVVAIIASVGLAVAISALAYARDRVNELRKELRRIRALVTPLDTQE